MRPTAGSGRWPTAAPNAIRCLLQEAVDNGLVPAADDGQAPDAAALRRWLKRYGVGVDCSGFVQQALTRIMARLTVAGHAGQVGEIGFLRTHWAYRQVASDSGEDDALFEAVPSPSAARPGDILVRPGHIRIVVSSEAVAQGSLILHLAESTSVSGIPSGHAAPEPDLGPALVQACFPAPHLPIGRQSPGRRRPWEHGFTPAPEEGTYLIGRFIPLGREAGPGERQV